MNYTVMLLRNFEPPKLCNCTRLIINEIKKNVIEATIITVNFYNERVLIPKIPLNSSNNYHFEFKKITISN